MPEIDLFSRMVDGLNNGDISLTHIQNAVRQWIRENPNIPEESKSILAGGPGLGSSSGLIYRMFGLMQQTIGGMELAVRRAKD